MMIDIDYFKTINDTYGHLNGDYILKSASSLISSTISTVKNSEAIVARYGGEEFIVFIQFDSSAAISDVAEEVRKEFEQAVFCTASRKKK